MIPLFVGLTLVNLLCLGVATAFGYASLADGGQSKGTHILAGAMAALVCVGVHCVVFTYFIATAKWVQHAVLVKRLDEQFNVPTRSFRMQAFPAALVAMGAVFLAAVLGAARDNYNVPRIWHHSAAIAALAINLLVAAIEYRAIARNGRLIDDVLAAAAARDRVTQRDGGSAGDAGTAIDAPRGGDDHASRPAAPVAQRQRQRT